MKKEKISFSLIILSILPIMIGITSCSDNNSPTIEPTTNSINFISKSQNIIEFQIKEPNEEIKNPPLKDAETFFGDRLTLTQPEKIIFRNDSLALLYPGDLLQKYKISWKDKKLYLYNNITTEWEYCGIKDKQTTFILNIGYYLIKDKNSHGTLSIVGQKFSLLSYSELIEYMGKTDLNISNQIIWLKMQSTFEQNP